MKFNLHFKLYWYDILYKIINKFVDKKGVLFIYGKNSKDFENLYILDKYFESNIKTTIDEKVNIVKKIYFIAKAKVICVDQSDRVLSKIKIHNSIVVQVWHAGGAYKKFGLDGIDHRKDKDQEAKRVYRICRNITYAICSDVKLISLYAKAFGIDESCVLPYGLIRTDKFLYKHIYQNHNFKRRNILYAPSFRVSLDGKRYLDTKTRLLVQEIKNKFPYMNVMLRLHPSLCKDLYSVEGVIDVSSFKLREVLCKTDVLITDYSSIIFDYSMFNGLILFYLEDYYKYTKERDVYFNPLERYKDFSSNNIKDLLHKIISTRNNTIEFRKTFMSSCDGNVTKRVVNFIKTKLEV